MPDILAISLWQPWAHLIAIGAKRFETRSWSTRFRGMMAIHAGQKWSQRMARQCYEAPFHDALKAGGIIFRPGNADWLQWVDGLAFGAVIAVADLVEVWPTEKLGTQAVEDSLPADLIIGLQERAFGDFRHGRYAWQYENVIRLPEPIPCAGKQGLFVPPAEVMDRIMELV